MKILLVEEDASLVEILGMVLTSFKYDVVICRHAEKMIETVKSESPDLILIDRKLAHADGLDLSKAVKEDFLTAYIPIIVLIDRRQLRRDLLTIEQGIDDYIIKPPDPIDLQIRIELAVRRATHQFYANALTKLPGNRTIEARVKKAIESKEKFSFGYADIDRFKYFNDRYGYLKGDKVIIQTSQIISRTVKSLGNANDFVGHVGGDDFVFITTPDKEVAVSQQIINEFDRLIPLHYPQKDRQKGCIQMRNRQGDMRKVALMNISIALVDNTDIAITSPVELSRITFDIKRHLKELAGSKYLKNRRVKDSGVSARPMKEKGEAGHAVGEASLTAKKPLGQLLVDGGFIEENVLDEALTKHWNTGQSLGVILVEMKAVTEEVLTRVLKEQETTRL